MITAIKSPRQRCDVHYSGHHTSHYTRPQCHYQPVTHRFLGLHISINSTLSVSTSWINTCFVLFFNTWPGKFFFPHTEISFFQKIIPHESAVWGSGQAAATPLFLRRMESGGATHDLRWWFRSYRLPVTSWDTLWRLLIPGLFTQKQKQGPISPTT